MLKDMNRLTSLNALLNSKISDEVIEKILLDSGEKVKNDIVSLAPIDTGEYANSITVGKINKDNYKYSIEIYSDLNSGWKNIPLGYLLEWGTGIKGESTNNYDHGYSYRQTPWVYFNKRYDRWIFTYGNIARPHFYPGLHLNESYFKEKILKEIK